MDRTRKRGVEKSDSHMGNHTPPSSKIGRDGEALAVAFLERNGYRVIEQNYRCHLGEIDIVAVDRKTVCFVEVKTRSTADYDRPEVAVHKQKQYKLSRVALWFLKEKHLEDVRARFDVVAIRRQGFLNEIHHFKNAFEVMEPGKRR